MTTRRPSLDAGLVPAGVRATVRALEDAGFASVLVGGCVRDLLLQRAAKDWDVATAATPDEVQRACGRVTPIAPAFGTVLVHPDDGAPPIEVTTFRSESGYADRRRPDHVTFSRDVLEDLRRRDFTVNAIAWRLATGEILDPARGRADLRRRVLRTVGDPDERFHEDALRLVRAVRLAADIEGRLERRTRAAIIRLAPLAATLSAERVRDEIRKILALPRPSTAFELMADTGLLAVLFPELDLTRGVLQNRYHAYDVFHHTLASVDAAPRDNLVVRTAALFHDLGKPATRVLRKGDATFYEHEFVGATLAERVLARWRVPHRERERVVHLVTHHMFDYQPTWSDTVVRRFIRRVGVDALPDLFDLRLADYVGNGLRPGFPTYLDELRARIAREIDAHAPVSVGDLAVDGADVMQALGVPAGPVVGRVLDELLEWVTADPARNTRAHLLERMRAARGEPR